MLNQPIKLDNVTYEMLSTRCKKKHKKPMQLRDIENRSSKTTRDNSTSENVEDLEA